MCYPINISTKTLFSTVGTQQIIYLIVIYYQSINLATCFGSLSHHQANSQTILKVRSVDVHIMGSKMFTNSFDSKVINDCLVASTVIPRVTKIIRSGITFVSRDLR